MNKKITVAVLGCGSRGLSYTEKMFEKSDKYEIVSLCDPNPAQLEKMKCGEITDEEIATAKNTLISGIKQIYDSPASIEAFFLRRALAGIKEDPEKCISEISALTIDDVVKAANKVELDTVYFLRGNEAETEDEIDE